ncbi:uncharacterized protein LOC18442567 [Amborella trichopoda]|uniref:DUF7026 domain-containing protein n=1 Tax=Amborella trichopoda TaxID=13333 RepID=U5CME8_AMBTC|nr:uncharacterized protein LOC18442567 [Amborella trichopoda]ERN14311.1 hypothetical protein AMTR_s00033p00193140 [Amborella trichopoda]|eukprot:XP_006852844.1 uncharacterized protein LOC18442567 [Amborella trichopoda]
MAFFPATLPKSNPNPTFLLPLLPQILSLKNPNLFLSTKRTRIPSLLVHSKSSNGDADIAAELRAQAMKAKANGLQRENAMKKSRELLLMALCDHTGMANSSEMARRWRALRETEKWDCLRGFVDEWGEAFSPLSLRSMRAMIEEHLEQEASSMPSSSSSPPLMVAAFTVLQKKVTEFLVSRNEH